MKRPIILSLFIMLFVPFFSMTSEANEAFDCYGLGDMLYGLTKDIGRNDFLYLARANWLWFLQKKIKSQENIEDIDKYYVGYGRTIEGVDASLYHTPLHEAVGRGNLQIVKLLCSAGADLCKTVKSIKELDSSELAQESYQVIRLRSSCILPISESEINKQIEHFKKDNNHGLSALELAEYMLENSQDKNSERQEIMNFLRIQSKKD
ncbi:MAG: ankyrin repeat domain-containing protein [Candidatus Babeliales bacterium]